MNSNAPSFNNTFQNATSPLPTMESLMTPDSLNLFNFVYENPTQQIRSPKSNYEDDLSRVITQWTYDCLDANFFGQLSSTTGNRESMFIAVIL